MGFCKVCLCGQKIVFETRNTYPQYCPACGRGLLTFTTYDEMDPRVAEMVAKNTRAGNAPDEEQPQECETAPEGAKVYAGYVLARIDGSYVIDIPAEGGVVGRNGLGAAYLAGNSAVSREHLRVTPALHRPFGVIIEDVSRFGTMLNGESLLRGEARFAPLQSHIRLYDEELILQAKEGTDHD